MGEVLLVRHTESNRLAALKLLSNQATRERFVREMRLLKRFSHPNIVRYLDHVESAEDVYLVMQYVPGSNLDDHLLELGRPIEPARAVQVASECLSALAYLHRHPEGVFVHRDMKPENVLMASCAEAPSTPYITDFGLAKNVKGRTRLTRFGIMMGSCGFSPWEQMRDASSAGAPADTYALGMILYYMLTGLFPYHYPSPLEVLERARLEGLALSGRASFQRIQNELTRERGLGTDFFEATLQCCLNDRYQPIPLRERSRTEISPAVTAVVDRAVSKRIESRYADAVEMLEALHAAVSVAGWRANGG
jgi:serine/threonine protein kinase